MKLFLEKFEANYLSFLYNDIAEATYRCITEHSEKVYHLVMRDNFMYETEVYCEELDKTYYFDKQLDYNDSSIILNGIERALRSML